MDFLTKQPAKRGDNQWKLLSIPEYIHHLSKELEIENISGLNGNEMELIALIRNCPLLYNPSHPDFKITEKRDQAWKAIAKVFSVSANELQYHWKHMIESFKKYLCKNNLDPNIKTCVTYFDEMKFLLPFINRGKSTRTSPNTFNCIKEDSNTSASSELEVPNKDYNLKLEVLIDAVSLNPVLYDRKHGDAKNQDVKLKTWKKIAENLGIPVSECINKWKILRERYAREKKYRKFSPCGKRWHLFDKLLFLENHIMNRRKLSSGQIQNGSTTDEENQCFNIEYIDGHWSNKDLRSSTCGNNCGFSTAEYEDEIFRDEDDLFGIAMVAEMKKISTMKKKMKLKADIYRLLYECSD